MKAKQQIGEQRRGLSTLAGVFIEQHLRKLAGSLQRHTSGLSLSWQKRGLLLYCLLAVGVSIGVCYDSLFSGKGKGIDVASITITPIPLLPSTQPLISTEEYNQIHALRLRLDSLYGNAKGDSFPSAMREAWTLRDTLMYLEQVYQQQHK